MQRYTQTFKYMYSIYVYPLLLIKTTNIKRAGFAQLESSSDIYYLVLIKVIFK